MTKRTTLALTYSGGGSSRWLRTAAATTASDLARLAVWQWQQAEAARRADAHRPALSLSEFPEAAPPPRAR
jgi:hypothetical protein